MRVWGKSDGEVPSRGKRVIKSAYVVCGCWRMRIESATFIFSLDTAIISVFCPSCNLKRISSMTSGGIVAEATSTGTPVGIRRRRVIRLLNSGRKSSVPHSVMVWPSSMDAWMILSWKVGESRTTALKRGSSAISGPRRPTRYLFFEKSYYS